jgi:hypothetical protein
MEKQFHLSFAYAFVNQLENRYHIVENLDKIELTQRVHTVYEKIRIQRVIANLFPEDTILQKDALDFSLWICSKPSYFIKLPSSPEAKKSFEKFLQIPDAKEFWEKDIDIQNLKNQKDITIVYICDLLTKPSTIKLLRQSTVYQIIKEAKFGKIKSEVEQQ